MKKFWDNTTNSIEILKFSEMSLEEESDLRCC